MHNYVELDGLSLLLLEESYVLDVNARPGTLSFYVDFVLTPNHREYRDPAPGETFCMRRGLLQFERVTSLTWTNQGTPPARDATGESDYGAIDSFRWSEDEYQLEGDWGEIIVRAVSVKVDLEPEAD